MDTLRIKTNLSKLENTELKLTDKNWIRYEGYFKEGRKEGKGILYMSNGRVFEGQFRKGVVKGYGVLKIGEEHLAGRWNDGVLVSLF